MSQLFQLLGGLGIFLLGVVIMTNGLRGLAGEFLRSVLTQFTRSPTSGAITGAISTAILQSSSATTVAAVGFVGAGLLTFPQALGIIFGANLGTTITGWLVALLGLKFKLGTFVLPLILAGILIRLFGRGKVAESGFALAGFGLIFVGIDAMQNGMSGLESQVTSSILATDTLWGRFKLVLIGITITLLTQSSSAGVAAALTAVYTGTLNFEQAAAMVIGMNVGTTATAVFATLGGSAESRRTGYSHVIFNLMTGVGAFFLLTPYVMLWHWIFPQSLESQVEIALVAFHSSFNLIGVIAVLPFTNMFANFVIRLVPERESPLVKRLNKQLLNEPAVALEAVRETLNDIAHVMFLQGDALLKQARPDSASSLEDLSLTLDKVQHYVDYIHLTPDRQREWAFLMACIHAVDHMQRLLRRYRKLERTGSISRSPVLRVEAEQMAALFGELGQCAAQGHWAMATEHASRFTELYHKKTDSLREQIIYRIASGKQDTVKGNIELEAARWLSRVADHAWRISRHLQVAEQVSYKPTEDNSEEKASGSL